MSEQQWRWVVVLGGLGGFLIGVGVVMLVVRGAVQVTADPTAVAPAVVAAEPAITDPPPATTDPVPQVESAPSGAPAAPAAPSAFDAPPAPPPPAAPAVAARAASRPVAAGAVICVDPGHPSETSDGTRAASGLTENHVNWVVALKLRELLTERGHQVVLTKPAENQRVTNIERAQIANAASAAVMVRLHCDTGGGRGFTFYYPDRPGTKNGVTGPSAAVCEASGVAAKALAMGMREELGDTLRDNGIRTDRQTAVGSKQGALTGSIYSQVPAVTVEMVFLSDAGDAAWIAAEENQWRMAAALTRGIEHYLAVAGG